MVGVLDTLMIHLHAAGGRRKTRPESALGVLGKRTLGVPRERPVGTTYKAPQDDRCFFLLL